MKRIFILLVLSVFLLVGCNQNTSTREKVKINLPTDNTVNGYVSSAKISTNSSMPDTINAQEVAVGSVTRNSAEYCGNKNSKVFHLTTCSSAEKMKSENKITFACREDFIKNGYKPCSRCTP